MGRPDLPHAAEACLVVSGKRVCYTGHSKISLAFRIALFLTLDNYMTQQNVAERLPLTAWQVKTLRLTAFPSPSAQFLEPTWWADLVGEPPESKTLRPRERVQQEEGLFEGKKLVLNARPTRIDWLFTPIDDRELEVEDFPTLGPFSESLDIFLPLMLRWFELETCPSVQRLAFGAILLHSVESRQAGDRQISAYLPSVQLDLEGSSDLLYQINRPRDSSSGVPDLRINRLSKWSVATMKSVAFSMRAASVEYISARGEHFACRLELDINTSQYFQGELAREQLPQVFQELVDLGKEIAREGDIP